MMAQLPSIAVLIVIIAGVGSACTAALRARACQRQPAGDSTAGAAGAGADTGAGGRQVSQLTVVSSLLSALSGFVLGWLVVDPAGWVLIVWVLAALVLLPAVFISVQALPDLPGITAGRRTGELMQAVVEIGCAVLISAAAIAAILLAAR